MSDEYYRGELVTSGRYTSPLEAQRLPAAIPRATPGRTLIAQARAQSAAGPPVLALLAPPADVMSTVRTVEVPELTPEQIEAARQRRRASACVPLDAPATCRGRTCAASPPLCCPVSGVVRLLAPPPPNAARRTT